MKVVKVEQRSNGKIYAVKVLSKEPLQNKPKEVQLVRNEISFNGQLSHPSIAEMIEFHETEGSIYIVLEYVEGTPIISSKTPKLTTNSQVKSRIRCLLEALQHMEKKGIVHRDLKPYNILYEKDQNVSQDNTNLKLIDFGLAETKENPNSMYRQCGTPGFIAPEVFRVTKEQFSKVLNSKIDVFSVGILFHYLMFRVYPFGDDQGKLIFERNKKGEFLICDIEEQILNCEDRLGYQLLTMMLETNPLKRPTISEALKHPYFVKDKCFTTSECSTGIIGSAYSSNSGAIQGEGFMKKVFDSDDESEFNVANNNEGSSKSKKIRKLRSLEFKNKFRENSQM